MEISSSFEMKCWGGCEISSSNALNVKYQFAREKISKVQRLQLLANIDIKIAPRIYKQTSGQMTYSIDTYTYSILWLNVSLPLARQAETS